MAEETACRKVIVPLAEALDPTERLARAVRLIERSVEANKRSVAEFQLSLDELRLRARSIEAGLSRYNGHLEDVREGVGRLGREARRTIELMDQASRGVAASRR